MYRNTYTGETFKTKEETIEGLEKDLSFQDFLNAIVKYYNFEDFATHIDLDFLNDIQEHALNDLFNIYIEEEE